MLNINGVSWRILLVPPTSSTLARSDGSLASGVCDNDTCYEIDMAWGVFDVEDYKKFDPEFEIKLTSKKYNL